MATLGTTALTYADWAKRQDDDGKTAVIVDLLSQANEILDDMLVVEGNLPTGHKTTVRTGLPQGTWRQLNFDVQNTKSTTAQIVDTVGNLEAYSVIDKDIADLNGNTARFRLSEDSAFFEGMGQQMAAAFIYSNALSTPAQIMGLAPRYNTVSLANAQTAANVIDMGGTGSTNTSLWFVSWGENTIQAYLSVIEQALDLLTMQAQQLAEQEGRTLQFPIVDQAPTTTLPAAVQRANMGLAFDANGNPIAGALPSIAVSSAMTPVFQAASLAAGRSTLGLGTAALANTGQSGANVPLLNAALTPVSATAGAALEEFLILLRNKGAGGANNDFGEALAFAMMNAADAQKTFARTYAQIIAATAGAETGALLFDTVVAGTLAARMALQSGLVIGAPTGGDKGAGTVNAAGYYLNGTALAVPAFTKSFVSSLQTITSAGALTIAHGLGVAPAIVFAEIVNEMAEGGYTTGQTAPIDPSANSSATNDGISIRMDDPTNLIIRFGSSANVLTITHATSGQSFTITPANWKLVLKAYA
jgi:hypothetical protein